MLKYRLLKLKQAQEIKGNKVIKENTTPQVEEESFTGESLTYDAIPEEDLKVAVCGIGKLENHYICEWVEHYKNIGVDNIILIDNNDPDGERYEEVIQDYIDSGFVILEDYRGAYRIQIQAYDNIYHKYGDKYDWIGYFDIDEFLELEDKSMTIKSFLAQENFNPFKCIRFNWKVYTDNDIIKVENNNYSITRFTETTNKNKACNKQSKSFLRTKQNITINSSHGCTKNSKLNTCNVYGKKCKNDIINCTTPIWEVAWVNHYMLKTIEEYILGKMKRKWPTWYCDGGSSKLDLDYFFEGGINKKTNDKLNFANSLLKIKMENPANNIAIVGIGKMENHYIREWVEHYKNIGADNIILIDNNDPDGERFEDVIGDYIDSGFVILVDYRGKKGEIEWRKGFKSTQIEAYNFVYKKFRTKYSWFGFFDVDEYVEIEDKGNTLHDILFSEKYNNFDAIKLNWKNYGDNNLVITNNNYKIKERFITPCLNATELDSFTKGFLRGGKNVTINSAHLFQHDNKEYPYSLKVCNSLGENENNDVFLKNRKIIHKIMWVNHYRFKTIEEYITNKMVKGWPDNFEIFAKKLKLDIDTFFRYNNKTTEKEVFVKNTMDKKTVEKTKDCTGCAACVQICPKNAISMIGNEEGFLYPKIDADKCVNCGLCKKTCPLALNTSRKEPKAYAAYNLDDDIRKKSSSGGIFHALAENIISNKGVVFAVKYDDKFNAVYGHFDKMEDIEPYMQSKYTQAIVGNTYKEVKEYLNKDILVLFVGTPCQIAGLNNFLGKDYEKLYSIEIVCHGVPSTTEWRKHLANKEKVNGKLMAVNQRNKDTGWKSYASQYIYENGKQEIIPHSNDSFMKLFLSDTALRDSCYNCHSKAIDTKCDLSIGDFWGVSQYDKHMDDNKGLSIVLCNTDKGEKLLNNLKTLKTTRIEYNSKAKSGNGGLKNIVLTTKKKTPQSKSLTKIGVQTLGFNSNYGGVIQSFALCETIKKLGYTPVLMNQRITPLPFDKNIEIKNKDDGTMRTIIAGSDQIWRMKYIRNIEHAYLGYVDDSTNKISYAASFGVDEWEHTTEETQQASNLIKRFKAVSVREDNGVELCSQNLHYNKAVHVLDPTLLLEPDDYRKAFEGNVKYDFHNKMFAYILDVDEKKTNLLNKAQKVGEKSGVLITLGKTQPSIYEWLNGFANADYVITDSFHGCVFSIIFNKPFICINNITRGGARMKSLIKQFNIQNRMIDIDKYDIDEIVKLLNTPLDVKEVLDKWKEKSLRFLKDNI